LDLIEIDGLVVGAGPAGLPASTLLPRTGVSAVATTKYSGAVDSPRAHVTNQSAVEILHDLGVEDDLRFLGRDRTERRP
jgi:2,4-dichlorophenol 6-monooxygenase